MRIGSGPCKSGRGGRRSSGRKGGRESAHGRSRTPTGAREVIDLTCDSDMKMNELKAQNRATNGASKPTLVRLSLPSQDFHRQGAAGAVHEPHRPHAPRQALGPERALRRAQCAVLESLHNLVTELGKRKKDPSHTFRLKHKVSGGRQHHVAHHRPLQPAVAIHSPSSMSRRRAPSDHAGPSPAFVGGSRKWG